MPCRSYLIRNQICELILCQSCARNERHCEAEANRESNLATLHTRSLLGWCEPDERAAQ